MSHNEEAELRILSMIFMVISVVSVLGNMVLGCKVLQMRDKMREQARAGTLSAMKPRDAVTFVSEQKMWCRPAR